MWWNLLPDPIVRLVWPFCLCECRDLLLALTSSFICGCHSALFKSSTSIKSKVDVKVAVPTSLGLVRTAELHDINDRVAELAAVLARPCFPARSPENSCDCFKLTSV